MGITREIPHRAGSWKPVFLLLVSLFLFACTRSKQAPIELFEPRLDLFEQANDSTFLFRYENRMQYGTFAKSIRSKEISGNDYAKRTNRVIIRVLDEGEWIDCKVYLPPRGFSARVFQVEIMRELGRSGVPGYVTTFHPGRVDTILSVPGIEEKFRKTKPKDYSDLGIFIVSENAVDFRDWVLPILRISKRHPFSFVSFGIYGG